MDTNTRALVAMDLSPTDHRLLEAINQVRQPLGIKTIYFLHIMPDFTVPENVDVEFQKMFAPDQPVDEKVTERLQHLIDEQLEQRSTLDIYIDVREGKPYQKVVHWIDVKETHLLILGNKAESADSGVTARRVARKAHSNILFVPEKPIKPINRILVPIDFSDNSARAIRTAMKMTKPGSDAAIDLLYVIDMPPAEYYVGAARDAGLRGLLKDSAREAYQRFMKEYGFDEHRVKIHFVENAYSNIAAHIHEFAGEQPTDFVIVGAQGHSALERFIFGSVTERLVELDKEHPVLVVR